MATLEDKYLKQHVLFDDDDDDARSAGSGGSRGLEEIDEEQEHRMRAMADEAPTREEALIYQATSAHGSKSGGAKAVLEDSRIAEGVKQRLREEEALRTRHEIQLRSGGVPTDTPSMSYSATAEAHRAVMADRGGAEDRSCGSDSDLDDSDDENDPALVAWRRQRLMEMQQQAATSGRSVDEVIPRVDPGHFLELLAQSERAGDAAEGTVVVVLEEEWVPSCRPFLARLAAVAPSTGAVNWIRMAASEADELMDHIALPTVNVYRRGVLVSSTIRAADELRDVQDSMSDAAFVSSVLGVDTESR